MGKPAPKGAASAAPTFDARAWFAAWSDNGGIAMVAADRLFLSRASAIDHQARQRLDMLRAEIIGQRDRGEALAAYLVARSFGEIRP